MAKAKHNVLLQETPAKQGINEIKLSSQDPYTEYAIAIYQAQKEHKNSPLYIKNLLNN
jgi:hypothetical protein